MDRRRDHRVARPLVRFCSSIRTGEGTTGLPGLSSGSAPQYGQAEGPQGLPGLFSGSAPQYGQAEGPQGCPASRQGLLHNKDRPRDHRGCQASSQVLLHNTERKYKIAFIFFFVVVKFDLNAFSYHCPHNPALEGIYSSSSFSVSLVEARKKGVDLCVRVHHSLQYW